MKKATMAVTPPDFFGIGTFELKRATNNPARADRLVASNVGRGKTNGKRGSAIVLYLKFVLTLDSLVFHGMRASHP